MTRLTYDKDTHSLKFTMSTKGYLASIKKEITLPLDEIAYVEIVNSLHTADYAHETPIWRSGTYIPKVVVAGTFRHNGFKDFLLFREGNQGVEIFNRNLNRRGYDKVVFKTKDPLKLKTLINNLTNARDQLSDGQYFDL